MAASTPRMETSVCAAGLSLASDIEFVNFGELAPAFTPRQMVTKCIGSFSGYEFTLDVFPCGFSEENAGEVQVVVLLKNQADQSLADFTGKCVAELLPEGWEPMAGNVRKISLMPAVVQGASLYDGSFGKVEDIRCGGFLADGNLRLRVRIDPTSLPGLRAITLASLSPNPAEAEVLAKDLGSLLTDSSTFDVKLIAEGRDFNAHWSILAARSPVFKAMLEAQMSEAGSRQVEIPDMDAVSLSKLLHFIYTGTAKASEGHEVSPARTWTYSVTPTMSVTYEIRKTAEDELVWMEEDIKGGLKTVGRHHWRASLDNGDNLELCLKDGRMESKYQAHGDQVVKISSAHSPEVEVQVQESWGRLLHAADKYCISGLARLCEEAMQERLLVCSAATVLQIASNLGRDELKKATLNFITMSEAQTRAVRDTPAFDSLERELLAEVYEVFMDSRSSSKRRRASERGPASDLEFPDGSSWARLSNAQLRRACAERSLPTGGNHSSLVALLQAQERRGD